MNPIIDIELLMNVIQERPGIWDIRNNDYSDRNKKKRSWEEVVIIFAKENSTEEEKKNLGILIQKIWKNLRDQYSRQLKESKRKSGRGVRKKSPYMYTHQLSFLEDTIKNHRTSNSLESNEEQSQEEAEDPHNNLSTPSSLRENLSTETPCTEMGEKSRLNPVETKLIEALDKKAAQRERKDKLDDDDDKLFLLSLLPSLKSIPPHFKLNARMDIMQCINKYFFHSTTTIPSSNIPYHQFVSSTSYQPTNNFQSQIPIQQQMQSQSQTTYDRFTPLLTKKSTGSSQANLESQRQPHEMQSCFFMDHEQCEIQHQHSPQIQLQSVSPVLSPVESIQSYVTNLSAEDSEMSLF